MKEVNPRCKVFVVALTAEVGNAVRFTNYPKPNEGNDLVKQATIWEAARPTSSAPAYLNHIVITRQGNPRTFIDGGLGNNNPVNELWIEVLSEYGNTLAPQIRLILSTSTYRPVSKEIGNSLKNFGRTVIKVAAETQKTTNTFDREHKDLVDVDGYFRFNPPNFNEVGLGEASKKGIIQ